MRTPSRSNSPHSAAVIIRRLEARIAPGERGRAQFVTDSGPIALKSSRVENESRLEPVADLIQPESLQALEADVQVLEVLTADIADGLDRLEMAVEQFGHGVANLASLLGQADMNGASIDVGALVIDVAGFDKFLQIVRNVRSEIVTACPQLARRQFLVPNVEQEQSLDAVDHALAAAVQFILDHVEQLAVQALHEIEAFKITRPQLLRFVKLCRRSSLRQYRHAIPPFGAPLRIERRYQQRVNTGLALARFRCANLNRPAWRKRPLYRFITSIQLRAGQNNGRFPAPKRLPEIVEPSAAFDPCRSGPRARLHKNHGLPWRAPRFGIPSACRNRNRVWRLGAAAGK